MHLRLACHLASARTSIGITERATTPAAKQYLLKNTGVSAQCTAKTEKNTAHARPFIKGGSSESGGRLVNYNV